VCVCSYLLILLMPLLQVRVRNNNNTEEAAARFFFCLYPFTISSYLIILCEFMCFDIVLLFSNEFKQEFTYTHTHSRKGAHKCKRERVSGGVLLALFFTCEMRVYTTPTCGGKKKKSSRTFSCHRSFDNPDDE
jgi:hypothetical protein